MSETIIKVENKSGGSVGDWTFLKQLKKSFNYDYISVSNIPSGWKELYILAWDTTDSYYASNYPYVIPRNVIDGMGSNDIKMIRNGWYQNTQHNGSAMLRLTKTKIGVWDIYINGTSSDSTQGQYYRADVYYR